MAASRGRGAGPAVARRARRTLGHGRRRGPGPGTGRAVVCGGDRCLAPERRVARERQAIAITELDARHRRELPTIIAGDFNAGPDAASIRYLTGRQSLNGRSVLYHDAWSIAGDGPGDTWPAAHPEATAGADQIIGQPGYHRRFDYVFVGSREAHLKAHARVLSAALAFDKPSHGIWPSDHLGLVVDLDIGKD